MTAQERKAFVINSKKSGQTIIGEYIDLYPYLSEYGESIVKLRNQEMSRYYLNQKEPLTVEEQNKWYNNYKHRDNDVYWCILNKSGVMVGVVRLYDIEMDGSLCEEGSFIIDRAYSMSSPYALEAKLLVFNFAFDTLQINRIINTIRTDNKNMNSIAKRIGFTFTGVIERNCVPYQRCELKKNTYRKTDLETILAKWRERD